MKKLKIDLQAVSKSLTSLTLKVEKIRKQIEKMDKPKAAKVKPVKKAPVKKVAAKKAVAKKVPAKKVAAKKAVTKKAPAKKPVQITAFEILLRILRRSKKGIDVAALMKKTGFNQKKIANLVLKGRKLGQIKSVEKGVYLKA